MPRRSIVYHNPFIDKKSGVPDDYPVISDGELERIEDDYVRAAGLAIEAGFRAIDIKVTHGYLLSELTGAKTREGRYGGSLENRLRLVCNTIGKIRDRFGDRLLICMRLGCFDGVPYFPRQPIVWESHCDYRTPYPYGFGVDANDPLREDLTEVKAAIAKFRECGVGLLNVSLGCPTTMVPISDVRSRSRTTATTNSPSIRCWVSTGTSASRASCSARFRICRWSDQAIAGCRSTH